MPSSGGFPKRPPAVFDRHSLLCSTGTACCVRPAQPAVFDRHSLLCSTGTAGLCSTGTAGPCSTGTAGPFRENRMEKAHVHLSNER